ncbi:hypothetical protein ACQCT5_11055, partial [Sutcliffiella halmapala]
SEKPLTSLPRYEEKSPWKFRKKIIIVGLKPLPTILHNNQDLTRKREMVVSKGLVETAKPGKKGNGGLKRAG